jgi:hypothetical protein
MANKHLAVNDSEDPWNQWDDRASTHDVEGGAEEVLRLKSNCGALLARQYHYVLPISLASYFIMQFFVGQDFVCNGHVEVKEWTQKLIIAVDGCFLLSALHHVVIGVFFGSWHTTEIDLSYPRSVYLSAATVSFVAGFSSLIKIFGGYQSICFDTYGVPSFSSQWPEWLVDVPLLGYMCVAIEDKAALETEDYFMIFAMWLMIFTGFAMNFTTNLYIGSFLCILSFVCILANFYVAFESTKELQNQFTKLVDRSNKNTLTYKAQWAFERLMMKGRLAWLLLYLLPTFPLVYVLTAFKVITVNQSFAGLMLCSVSTKLVFVGMLSLESVLIQLNQRKEKARKKFMQHQSAERFPLAEGSFGGISPMFNMEKIRASMSFGKDLHVRGNSAGSLESSAYVSYYESIGSPRTELSGVSASGELEMGHAKKSSPGAIQGRKSPSGRSPTVTGGKKASPSAAERARKAAAPSSSDAGPATGAAADTKPTAPAPEDTPTDAQQPLISDKDREGDETREKDAKEKKSKDKSKSKHKHKDKN